MKMCRWWDRQKDRDKASEFRKVLIGGIILIKHSKVQYFCFFKKEIQRGEGGVHPIKYSLITEAALR